ncbi:MAG: carbon monoxide dehydrogenase, partial [Lachnospiraceae bacterium]|nr:carbon monoxide dehydrogenase [Lachnospiraceae bacterium]
DLGRSLIDEYLKNPIVKSVQIIFITQFDKFDELLMLADKIKSTTSALNHILDNILFDCSTCNLKEICDEVEGMKELHMKKAKR